MAQSRQNLHHKFLNAVRYFNKYVFNHITLTFAGTGIGPFSILRHQGRQSGRIYQTPVFASYVGKTVIIPLSYGENVDWLRNVLARGGCELRWRNKWMTAGNPLVIGPDEAYTILPAERRKLFERYKMEKFVCMQLAQEEAIAA